ncbi:polysaccharide lyase family 3 protein [Tulasnella calospora MUT 4182]|uniref:Pectate lyase n=1 Tax=Tulasnella calospora MUT 4182 TaxID=1051891 RepID=A0A0C3QJP4_9AGAM|nr:polysaccharide lyase family 3 protein [Tulasnella calospora MUT 4182]
MKVAAVLSALAFAQGALSVAIYGQCGGIDGITGTCDSGLVCVVQNAYYFQCLTPASGQTTTGGSAATTTTTTTTKTSSTTTKTSTTTTTTTTKTTTTTVGSVPTGLTTTLPSSSGYSALPTASVITGTFDGGMKRFDRAGSSGACQGQTETGESDAVFILESGATIQNVIIGADQAEGIHCRGPCTVKNVWWADVCEDAITIKQTGSSDVSYIIGGGAFHAEDKVVQHNGAGTVSIKNFYVSDFGKLYRSCGNCSTSYARHVIVDNVAMASGSAGVGVNSNFGDTATITNVCTNGKPTAANVCCWYEGTTPGNEPTKLGCGSNGNVCNYSTSSITTC